MLLKKIQRLSEITPDHIGSAVKLHGWVYSTRTQGAGTLVFIDLGDGSITAPVRCVAHKTESVSEPDSDITYGSLKLEDDTASADVSYYTKLVFDQMTEAKYLCLGCSVMLWGIVVKPPPNTTQTFEIAITDLWVIGGVSDPSAYPIQKSILKKPAALRQHYHSRFRAPLIQQLMAIRSAALQEVHAFFDKEGVPILDPSIMTSSDCEGAGEMFKVAPQFFSAASIAKLKGEQSDVKSDDKTDKTADLIVGLAVGLTVSSQLPLEAIAMGTGSVVTIQKSFRAEESDTVKHLAEFLHVEFERYFITLDELIDFTERFVKYLIRSIVTRCKAQYDFLDSDVTAPPEFHKHRDFLLSLLDRPFVRIRHAEAIQVMQDDLRNKVKVKDGDKEVRLKFKVYPLHGQDLGSEHEKYLVQKYSTFVFVTHWPSEIKSFYMKQVGDGSEGICESFDLLAPLVGEMFGGSMREWRYDVLESVMKHRGMDMAPLQWFVDLRKDGTAPHGGWGMGFDRLVMFLTGASSVRDIVPYPVYYGHCPY
jgi:asparaginyl-tRNA synthetase